jgi:hypothetical protein
MSKSTRAAPRAAFRSPASGQRDRLLRRALTAAIVLIMILAAVARTSSDRRTDPSAFLVVFEPRASPA